MRTLVVCLLGVILFSATSSSAAAKQWQEFCPTYARNFATYSKSRVQSPPNPVGRWTSESCEVTPGPRFLLRDTKIDVGTRWRLQLHHYKDSWCSLPLFTVVVSGSYDVKDELNSVRGSYNADFSFDNIALIAHDASALENVLRIANSHCPNANLPILSATFDAKAAFRKKNFTVSKEAVKRRECREILGLHFYSYKIVRQVTQLSSSSLYDQLYFGELPTHRAKKTFISTALQLPLKRHNVRGCDACRIISASTPNSPPILRMDKRLFDFSGAWVSAVCEIQSDLFITRYLNFQQHHNIRSEKSVWELEYHYFVDGNCDTLSYIISASGNFTDYSPSTVINGASNYVFELTHLKITPMEELIVTFLRSADPGTCGVSNGWRLGSEQDVTSTGGCSAFGLKLPSLDYDIVRVIRESNGLRRLYTGQRPTDTSVPTTPSKRPTSFQIPLKRCSDVTRGITPLTTPRPTKKRSRKRIPRPKFTFSPHLLGRTTTPAAPTRKKSDQTRRQSVTGGICRSVIDVKSLWTLVSIVILLVWQI